MTKKYVIFFLFCFLNATITLVGKSAICQPIIERLEPVPKDAGFRMSGYFIWGGSLIRVDDRYHLFASRWPTWESLGMNPSDRGNVSMLGNYINQSEIVRAVSDNPLGPFEFVEVVLSGRGGDVWDGQMCHNPKIVKIKEKYVLYYIGRSPDHPQRKIGYAWAESIRGPWIRCDQQILLTDDANNPAPYIHQDGSVLLAFRDRDLTLFIAKAEKFDDRYQICAANLIPNVKLEDPTLFYNNSVYNMVLEDNVGLLTGNVRFGAHLHSRDGLDWEVCHPVKVYTHTIQWTDGTCTTFDRRERPELLNLNNPPERKFDGEPTHLITGMLVDSISWCVVQEIATNN